MNGKLSNCLLLLVAVLSIGCASSYKPINPSNLYLQTKIEDEDLSFSYEYDVLESKGNKRYSKKELRDNIKIVAVKIKNKTNEKILVSEDIGFYVNSLEVRLINPNQVLQNLNQNTVSYLFYLLLTPLKLISSNSNGSVNVTPIGYVIGPGLTLFNMITSGSANSSFKEELISNNIIGKSILPGETLSGIIAIRDIGYEPITITLKDKL